MDVKSRKNRHVLHSQQNAPAAMGSIVLVVELLARQRQWKFTPKQLYASNFSNRSAT